MVFYDYFDPAYKAGGPIRSLVNFVKLLGDKLEFYIVTGNKDHDGERLVVRTNQWLVYSDNTQVIYIDKPNRKIGRLKRIMKEIDPDCIYVNGIFSVFTTIIPLKLSKELSKPLVIAPRGMLQKGALLLKPVKKRLYLFLIKNLLVKNNFMISWHATDYQEKNDIEHIFGSGFKIGVIGNIPVFSENESISEREIGKRNRFVTISLVTRKKNHHVFINALTSAGDPSSVIYDIYGPTPDEKYLKELNSLIKRLPSNIVVNIKGNLLPQKVNQVLKCYDYFVLPTLGENFGHAIFEALNVGVPVIISDQTPWKGLKKKRAGWDVSLKKGNLDEAIEEALALTQKEYSKWQKGARKVAEEYMESSNLKERYLEMFEEMCCR